MWKIERDHKEGGEEEEGESTYSERKIPRDGWRHAAVRTIQMSAWLRKNCISGRITFAGGQGRLVAVLRVKPLLGL